MFVVKTLHAFVGKSCLTMSRCSLCCIALPDRRYMSKKSKKNMHFFDIMLRDDGSILKAASSGLERFGSRYECLGREWQLPERGLEWLANDCE